MPVLCLIEPNAACMASCVSACSIWEVFRSTAFDVPLKIRSFLPQLVPCGLLIVPCS